VKCVMFLCAILAAWIGLAAPSGAITGGELDGDRHPNVALIAYYTADGRFRCTATLVSPTVLVTAAHCTEGVRGKTIVRFDPVVPPLPRASDDAGDGKSAIGYSVPAAGWVVGTAHTHPLWDGKLQLNDLHDVGVVVLDEPYTGATPAALAPAGYLEALAAGNGGIANQLFTLVGYGVFFERPSEGPQKPTLVSDRTRRFTEAPGQNVASQTLKLAENALDPRGGGGTCFGDSGGPALHGTYLVGLTSYGASPLCRSAGVYYRLDTDDARSFLDDFVAIG
jgi:hypothetical protein